MFIKRPALIVASLDRALAVYRDALGLEVSYIRTLEGDSWSYQAFNLPRGTPLRFAAFNTSERDQNILALIEHAGAAPQPDPSAPRSHAVVIHIDAFDATLERLAAVTDVTLLPSGTLTTHDGRIGREGGFIDRDGHLIVLYHLPAA